MFWRVDFFKYSIFVMSFSYATFNVLMYVLQSIYYQIIEIKYDLCTIFNARGAKVTGG